MCLGEWNVDTFLEARRDCTTEPGNDLEPSAFWIGRAKFHVCGIPVRACKRVEASWSKRRSIFASIRLNRCSRRAALSAFSRFMCIRSRDMPEERMDERNEQLDIANEGEPTQPNTSS
mmetsp:Transcript_65835/g.183416  ORF Transcript_65835/g.183416 Transcript_65835/m.183416 type:complete len:118 (-) Transcript_65835:2130-2483(-)